MSLDARQQCWAQTANIQCNYVSRSVAQHICEPLCSRAKDVYSQHGWLYAVAIKLGTPLCH